MEIIIIFNIKSIYTVHNLCQMYVFNFTHCVLFAVAVAVYNTTMHSNTGHIQQLPLLNFTPSAERPFYGSECSHSVQVSRLVLLSPVTGSALFIPV